MPLKAKLDGRAIISVLCSDEEWSEAQVASKGSENRLRMSCCGVPAYASHSPLDLRYFAHKPGYERCPSSGVSDEHECLKAAAASAVHSLPGWKADVEVSGEGWRADVLAVRKSIKIAIEIQLSAQAKRATDNRNDRFEASEVTALWLKGPKNHFNDFGDGLQAPVQGASLREQVSSVQWAVKDMLEAVERQVKMANVLARLIRSIPEWTHEINLQGTIPACFELRRGDKKQQILLGELGPSLLPTIFRPIDGKQIGIEQFAGAILQIRVNAPHLRGYQSSSFQLPPDNISGSVERQLRPILEGKRKWQGKEHIEVVPGSFVHYPEDCSTCGARFLRIAHLLIGHPRHPSALPVKVITDDWRWYRPILARAETLSGKINLPLGPLLNLSDGPLSLSARMHQICPVCKQPAPAPLISGGEAVAFWPDRDVHFRYRQPLPGKGWGGATQWDKRPLVDAAGWDALLDKGRAKRQQERKDERLRQELAAQELKRQREESRRQAEEQRLRIIADEAARKAAEEQRAIERRRREEESVQEELIAERIDRQNQLVKAAMRIIKDGFRRELWLTTSHPKLRSATNGMAMRPMELAAESKEELERALALLRSTKF